MSARKRPPAQGNGPAAATPSVEYNLPILPPLPSIEELGKQIAAATRAYHLCDEKSFEEPHAVGVRNDSHLLYERINALRDLVVTMPPRTLADAIQLDAAWYLSTDVKNKQSDYDKALLARRLERLLVSVLPIVVEAAGLDKVVMELEQAGDLAPVRYRAVEDLV